MKIFVPYSRTDAGHFAQKIHRDLSKEGNDGFTDVNSIIIGKWSNIIEENISKCNIFIVVVTLWAQKSQYVEREVLQAQRNNLQKWKDSES